MILTTYLLQKKDVYPPGGVAKGPNVPTDGRQRAYVFNMDYSVPELPGISTKPNVLSFS